MTPRWLRLNQAVEYSGLSHNTLRKYAEEGIIHAERTEGGGKGQGHRRFDRESIDDYFNRSKRDALAIFQSMRH